MSKNDNPDKSKTMLATIAPFAAIAIGLVFIYIGIITDEFPEMLSKAINLCLG